MLLARKSSKRPIVAIFAHPDDEAFGPAGTLAKLSETQDVYILCATKGEEGGKSKKIAQIREKELTKSAQILGIKKVFYLGFKDGCLCNNQYHDLAKSIEKKLKELKPSTILTFELNGVSGHIDHITVSLATTFVVTKLPFVNKILYFCMHSEEREEIKDYFIYFPSGHNREEVDEVIDINNFWDKKVKAMKAHASQKHDSDQILKVLERLPKEEYFFVKNRKDL